MGKSILTTILTITIAVICVATILVPTLSDATKTEETFTNEGLYRMEKYDTNAEITIVWDYTDPNALTINDERIDIPEQSGSIYLMTVCGSDEMLVRYGNFGTGYGYGVQLFDNTNNSAKITASVEQSSDLTITVSNGTATFTDGTTTVAVTYTDFVYLVSEEGQYVMKKSTDAVYLNGDSEFYGAGRSAVKLSSSGSTQTCLVVSGSIDDGITVTGMVYDFTTANENIAKTTVSGYIDLYSFTGITFDLIYTSGGVDYTSSQTYSQIIVPYEVTAELSQHLTDEQNSLIMVIPVLMICSILVAAIGMLYLRNRD